MDGLHEVRGLTVDARVRVDELGRVHLVAAVVALVAARALGATDRTRAFDVAVGQSAASGRGDGGSRDLLDHVRKDQQWFPYINLQNKAYG